MNADDRPWSGRSAQSWTCRDLLALALLAGLAFALHGRLALVGKVLVGEDLSRVEAPYRAIYAAALHEGRLPVWHPRLNLGAAVFAESQVGQLHPLNLLIFRVLDARAGGVVFNVLLSFLCGAAMYVYARELGLSTAARLLAALVYMLSGFFGAHVNHRYTFLIQGAHAPLILLLAERIATGRGRWAAWWGGLLIGLAVLAGHYHLTFMALVLYGLYGVWRVTQQGVGGRVFLARLGLLAAPVALAAGLSAVQWMPTSGLAGLFRGRDRGAGEMHPVHLVGFVSPYLFQTRDPLLAPFWEQTHTNYWESLAYVGMLPLCLAVFGFRRRRNAVAVPLAAAALVFTALCLGSWNPVWLLLLRLPGFSYFRAPGRYIFGTTLCVAPLAGLGLDALMRRRPERTFGLLGAAILLAGAITIALLVGLGVTRADGPAGALRWRFVVRWSLSIPIAAVTLLVLWRLSAGGRWGVRAAVVVAAAELLAFGVACQHRLLDMSDLKATQVAGPVVRILDYDAERGGRILCALHTWPIGPQYDTIAFLTINRPLYQIALTKLAIRPYYATARIMQAYGIRFVLSDHSLTDQRLVLRYAGPDTQMRALHGSWAPDTIYVYERRRVQPRAYVVATARWLPDLPLVTTEMTTTRFDPRQVVLFAGEPPEDQSATAAPVGSPGRCAITADEPTRVAVSVDAPRPAWLVLADLDYPGWCAEITRPDGSSRRAPIHRANVMLRAVRVPAGRSTVTFAYRPESLRIGAWISAAALAALALSALLRGALHRRASRSVARRP